MGKGVFGLFCEPHQACFLICKMVSVPGKPHTAMGGVNSAGHSAVCGRSGPSDRPVCSRDQLDPSFLFCKVGVLPSPASQDGQVAAKSECLGAEVPVGRVLKAAPPAPLVLVLSQPPASPVALRNNQPSRGLPSPAPPKRTHGPRCGAGDG